MPRKYNPAGSVKGTSYLVKIIDGIEPELKGPFKNGLKRDEAAIKHREGDPEKNDSLFRLDLDNGKPVISSYKGFELDGGEEDECA